jgi:hypothetical protein
MKLFRSIAEQLFLYRRDVGVTSPLALLLHDPAEQFVECFWRGSVVIEP